MDDYKKEDMGLSKFSLGSDPCCETLPMVSAQDTPKVTMPSTPTADKPQNQDGNAGKRAKFLS